ncbi:MAG: hypothetical protein RBT69_03700 [Spirochaetia bacterium]|jgi:hypothetical protein|nr:hypothetical protein [Spirochaetia bacterium]
MEDNGKEQIEIHYDRNERLAMIPEALLKLKSGKKGFFHNKSMAILFADIVIICLLSAGFFIYSSLTTNTYSSKNYSLILKGYIFNDTALVTLTITKKMDAPPLKTEPKPFEATITVTGNKNYYKKNFDFLPDVINRDVTVRASIPLDPADLDKKMNTIAYAAVKFENTSIKLKYKLKKEK